MDGKVDLSSDHGDSDANTNSFNRSLSEEFSIGNFNITDGGLKLTISCRKKSCDDELDKNRNDRLVSATRTDLIRQREQVKATGSKDPVTMDSENGGCPLSSGHVEQPELETSNSASASASDINIESQTLKLSEDGPESGITVKPKSSSLTVAAHGIRDKSLSNQCASQSNHVNENLPSYTFEAHRAQESVKQPLKIKQKANENPCALEVHDSHIKIETLPNVSPESGISSFDESPFGNESPDSFNNGEMAMDQHIGQSSSLSNPAQIGKLLETSPHVEHSESPDLHGKPDGSRSKTIVVGKEQAEVLSLPDSVARDSSVREASVSAIKSLTTPELSAIDSVEGTAVSHSSLSLNGNQVILSSPHKIVPAMGRKKRGRPPKTMKTLLLKHKKSTLYNGSYSPVHNQAEELNDVLLGKNNNNKRTGKASNKAHKHSGVNSDFCDKLSPPKKGTKKPKINVSNTKKARSQAAGPAVKPEHTQSEKLSSALPNENNLSGSKNLQTTVACPPKRPRGRPRKIQEAVKIDETGSKHSSAFGVVPGQTKPGKRKHSKRKLLFTRLKRKSQKNISEPVSSNTSQHLMDTKKLATCESTTGTGMLSDKTEPSQSKSPESSIFQDNDLDALLLSVKSSIKSQFKEEGSSDVIPNLTFDNPFAVMKPPPFPKVARPSSPRIVKPKAKRPKLHVMMRQTKRRKKKFVASKSAAPIQEPKLVPPPKLDVFSPVVGHERTDKFCLPPQKKSGTFGSALSGTKRPFFTSCVQPSKILASSRLNVFRSGTGVDESHRAMTPPDLEAVESFEKRFKKRHKLLYRKSKHKNIVDPVFAADLDTLLDGLITMTVSENPADNFIRVRPGEMPLPSIFRVIKIDVNRKGKERTFTPEPMTLDKPKVFKPRKDSVSPSESSAFSFRPVIKSGRKKSTVDSVCEQNKKQGPANDSCDDQRLPPKKRHRMVNLESSQETDAPEVFDGEPPTPREPKHLAIKKKGKRSRKVSGQDEGKSDSSQMSSKLGQQFVGQELTIDTSQGFLTCTPSLSPCPSRLSTRSSTLPSLSSPSPTGSVGFRNRSLSHNNSGKNSSGHNFPLACPVHSLSTSTPAAANSAGQQGSEVSDRSSCAECQLLEQSAAATISPGSHLRSSRFSLKALSGQPSVAAESSHSSVERRPSSSEPSPNLKLTPVFNKSLSRSLRKRRQSANLSEEESDSSPPRLEKNVSVSPRTNQDINFFSEPPVITMSAKSVVSPKQISSTAKTLAAPSESPAASTCSSKKKASSKVTPKKGRASKPLSSHRERTPAKPVPKKKCNTDVSRVPKKSSRSVITMSCPEHEPLPLEHCSNRKLIKEIKAATTLKSDKKSSDEESGPDEDTLPSPIQPPRKRYQRVGLFSDFYKDAEPRKRCENVVRCRDRLTYVQDEHEYGLLPQPLHIGQFYLKMQQDFQLPYDVWWQHVHQQLPKKPEPKIKFRNIRTNVYSDTKVSARKLEVPLCNCKPPENSGRGCQDDCLNRMIYTECSPSTCPLGENCGNQRIQKHEWAPGLEKFQTKDRGIGVITKNSVKTGQFILEYLGEVVSETEFRRRMTEEYSEECHHYALHLTSGSLIDGYRMGNIGRYVNHSCQPNCEMQKWNVNGLYRMVLFALRDIEAGEELGYDYNFDPFNQETQQECRCGSSECRGVIGGKRGVNTCKQADMVLEDSRDKRKSKCMNKKIKDKPSDSLPVQPLAKPMTMKERCYARKHCTFLVRNVDKVRNQRNPGEGLFPAPKEEVNTLDCTKINSFNPDLMLATLNERSVKTRLAAYAKDNPELARRHQLAQLFDKMLTELLSLKDEDGTSLVTPLMSLPSRKKQPQYYDIVREPIDMSLIKQRVKTGFYDHLSSFDADIMLLFRNVELYCGPKSDLGQIILKLRRVLNCVKTDVASQMDEILGSNTTKAYMDTELARLEQAHTKGVFDEPEEDIIRCICGVTRDEGLMLMCEKCSRWQHCDCVQASGTEEHYLCDRCEPRYYDPEILLIPPPSDAMPDCTHYMTLVKDDVQYAVGDCVYVMRDCKRTSTGAPLRTSHRLLATSSPDKLDVFRLDQLWKDPKGERFASGTPYLRPQETFHEPTRKFYHNELFRTPSFEIIPMELVMGKCIVMDPNTYCKGRPKSFKEQDIYICEYRVDKTAHLFHKIQKIWYPINTSKFCFDWYEKRLNIKRTFSPHEVPEEYKRKAERNMAAAPTKKEEKEPVKKEEKPDTKPATKGKPTSLGGNNNSSSSSSHGKLKLDDSIKNDLKLKAEVKVSVKKGGCHRQEDVAQMLAESKATQAEKAKLKRQERRLRLDKILTKLLNNIPGKQKVDLTYLLEDEKRIRKKITK